MTTSRSGLLLAAWICLAALGCVGPGQFVVEDTTLAAARSPFAAGVGEVVFTPPSNAYPLGGYGGGARRQEFPAWFGVGWPGRLSLWWHQYWNGSGEGNEADLLVKAKGVHDHLTAKALVLHPEGQAPWALVRIDAIGTPLELQQRVATLVEDELLIPAERVVVTATHTHSGVGSFFRAPFACLIAMDNFRPEMEERIAQACLEAVEQALETARPARIGVGQARDRNAEGGLVVAQNRRYRRFRDEIAFDDVDDEIGLLWLTDEDERPLALVLNYAVHPTVLGADNLHYSADLTGAAERAIEARLGAPALFVQGAEGDISPQRIEAPGGLLRCEDLGRALADLVAPVVSAIETHDTLALSTARGQRELGPAHALVSFWGRENFVEGYDGSGWALLPLMLPFDALLWALGATDARLTLTVTGSLGLVYNAGSAVPRTHTALAGVRLQAGPHDVALLTLPGEGTHDVGLRLRQQAAARGATQTFVLGLALDHVGYIASDVEYRRGGYEAWSTLFGPQTAERMHESQEALLTELYGGR